jgi:hypothetical protein
VFNDPLNWIDPLGLCKDKSAIDYFQDSLDFIGTFDPTPLVDLINGGIYAGRGKWDEAALSGISALPYLGDLLGKGGKLIRRGSKYADDTADLLKPPKSRGGLNIYKYKDQSSTKKTGWKEGDRFLYLPNKGNAKDNWKQNAGRLREEMRKGNPIYDSYRNPITGEQIKARPTPKSSGKFLNAERKLLESRGWKYNPKSGAYHPPGN